jgi:hypothetical protein
MEAQKGTRTPLKRVHELRASRQPPVELFSQSANRFVSICVFSRSAFKRRSIVRVVHEINARNGVQFLIFAFNRQTTRHSRRHPNQQHAASSSFASKAIYEIVSSLVWC